MTVYYRLCFLLLFVVATACSETKLHPLGSNGVILAFGDSLTAGVGTSPDASYPAVLANMTGRIVINSGVSGETSAEGLRRLPGVLDETQPDLLVLLEGGNDILRNQSTEKLKSNLRAMIELADARGVQLVLIGVPEKSLFSNSAPLYGELAEEYDLVFDGKMLAGLLRSPSLKSDQVHFNADGYREMAAAIQNLLKKNGAL